MFIRVHSWFVFIYAPLFHPRMICPVVGGRGSACRKQLKKSYPQRHTKDHEDTRRKAESIAFLVINPDKLKSRAIGKYDFTEIIHFEVEND